MDGFDFKKNHSSSSPKSPATQRFSLLDLQPRSSYSNAGMVNENDRSTHQMGSTLQSPKNFMSHTISTASKAASAKKILGERNEPPEAIVYATHVDKSPVSSKRLTYVNTGYNDLDRYSSLTPDVSSKVSELDQENISAANPSSQPYDPLTNYLSPRPKFLRYRPNRRREFLVHRENELTTEEKGLKLQGSVEEESDQSVDTDGSSSSSSGESLREDESNLSDDDEDMEEFEVDKKHLNFKKVFKTFLLLGILMLSTMYTSSMNSATPPPYIQALQVRECSQKVHKFLLRATTRITAMGFLDQEHENSHGVRIRNETVSPEAIQEAMVFSIGMQETRQTNDITSEVSDLHAREHMEASDSHMVKAGESFHHLAEEVELQQLENEAQSMPDSQTELISHWVDSQIAGSDPVGTEQEKDKAMTQASGGAADEGTLEQEIAGSEQVGTEQENDKAMTQASGGAASEGTLEQEIESRRERVQKISGKPDKMLELLDTEDNKSNQVPQTQLVSGARAIDVEEKDQIEHMASDIAMAAAGVSVIAISLVFGLLHLKNRKTIKSSPLRVQPTSEPVRVETSFLELSPPESMPKDDSLLHLSPSVHSMDKAFNEPRQRATPEVELLCEFTSSLKISGSKSKKVEDDVSFSTSQDKRPRGKIASSVNDIHQSPSESFAADFSSYGSFTAQKNIVMKEEGEEVKQVLSTPVRRSNRIRNRAVTSP